MTSAQFVSTFRVWLKKFVHTVTVLSVSSSCAGMLLIGGSGDDQLHVYATNGSHVKTITIPNGDVVKDAAWAQRSDNIVCITRIKDSILAIRASDNVIFRVKTLTGQSLGVSADNDMLLFTLGGDIFQSSDSGMTWRLAINKKLSLKWMYHHVIKVLVNNTSHVIWAIKQCYRIKQWILSTCAISDNSGENQQWRNVTLPDKVSVEDGKLAFDGHSSVLTTDPKNHAVHVWSVHGQYLRELRVSEINFYAVKSLAIDKQNRIMYVGQLEGTVQTFALLYQ